MWKSESRRIFAHGQRSAVKVGPQGSDVWSAYSADRRKDHPPACLIVAGVIISAILICGGLLSSSMVSLVGSSSDSTWAYLSGATLIGANDASASIVITEDSGAKVLSEKKKEEEKESLQGPDEKAGEMTRRSSKCEQGCSERGVCNEEIGRCDCPGGLVGSTYKSYGMPACHVLNGTGPGNETGRTGWGEGHINPTTDAYIPCMYISSCACAVQCDEHVFGRPYWCLDETENGTLQADGKVDPKLLFSRPLLRVEMVEGKEVRKPKEDCNHETASQLDCPMQCSGRGTCIQGKDGNPNYCLCPFQYEGRACESGRGETLGMECLNECSGKGECRDGFCKCDVGFFGVDCAIYLDSAGKPRLTPRRPYLCSTFPPPYPPPDGEPPPPRPSPRVYVYDLLLGTDSGE